MNAIKNSTLLSALCASGLLTVATVGDPGDPGLSSPDPQVVAIEEAPSAPNIKPTLSHSPPEWSTTDDGSGSGASFSSDQPDELRPHQKPQPDDKPKNPNSFGPDNGFTPLPVPLYTPFSTCGTIGQAKLGKAGLKVMIGPKGNLYAFQGVERLPLGTNVAVRGWILSTGTTDAVITIHFAQVVKSNCR